MKPERHLGRIRAVLVAALFFLPLALDATTATAFPVQAEHGVLPAGTELGDDILDQPTELFKFEREGGKRSYLFNLGDMAFSSPAIFGGVARQAGVSCNTCHRNGAGNARLFIPGLSTRHGNFDTSNSLFNPLADNGILDPLTPPSLRGIRYLAPYGRDGRFASLRDFVRNVIVNEFAGPEPSPELLDGLVAYMNEIEFLPNRQLGPGGVLTAAASEAAHRGATIFNRPFPKNAGMTCATCHTPTAAFVDHKQHDIGTGGLFKTPTLINANFSAPYFHDGRYDSYSQVVDYLNQFFELDLSAQDRQDLIAYLEAVGDADTPLTRDTLVLELEEIEQFASILDHALARRAPLLVALVVESVGGEWRELSEKFPGFGNPNVAGGRDERLKARTAIADLVLQLRRIEMAVNTADFDGAAILLAHYHQHVAAAKPLLFAAEPWSLFNPTVHAAHFTALRQLARAAAPKS